MSRNSFVSLILIICVSVSLGAVKSSKKKHTPAPQVAAFNTVVGSEPLPGMPPVTDPNDIYAAGHPNKLDEAVRKFPHRIYVPNSSSNTIDVIDPKKYKVIDHFAVGHQPQHVVPSWDMKTLWVLNDLGDSLTKIDPMTGAKGETVPVEDPYNMYYTPDGKYAIVVAEARARLDFRDPSTMKLVTSLHVPCKGVDHIDFSASGRYFLASCEFSGTIVKVDVQQKKLAGLAAAEAA